MIEATNRAMQEDQAMDEEAKEGAAAAGH